MKIDVKDDTKLLDLLKLHYPDSSNNTLRSWIEKERVSVDGKVVKIPNSSVKNGAIVSVGSKLQFLDLELRLLYEDGHLAVIYKPEGLLSVATDFKKSHTAHAILKKRREGKIVYPVHRLDRETSGVMVFAYSQVAREGLKVQFMEHSIQREYIAILEGHLSPKKGTWESYLVEDALYYVKTSPHEGKLGITHYEVLREKGNFNLVRFNLETGRKNQIRVHAQKAGHPVAGDVKYGAKTNPAKRLCLHAHKLGFIHPVTREKMHYESPLPDSFHKII